MSEERLAIRLCEAALAFVRVQNDHNRERLFAAMEAMAEGIEADEARTLLLSRGWVQESERDGKCWTHWSDGDGNVEVEISDGEAWLYGFERPNGDVSALDPAELRAFAALAEETRP